MQRIANGTQVAARPAREATSGTPGWLADTANGGPTRVSMDWLNDLQDEITNVLAAASISPGSATNQLLTAIQALIAAGSSSLLTDTGTANHYVVTPTPALGGYAAGDTFVFKAAHTNTGASDLNASALGAIPIVHRDGSALQAGDIIAGGVCRCVHDGAGHVQLEDMIPTLATTALEGLVALATTTQAAALSDTGHALTPAALAGIFTSANLNSSGGHACIPIMVGGAVAQLIVNWGEFSLGTALGATQSVTFDLAFPNTPAPVVPGVINGALQMIGYSSLSNTGVTFGKGTGNGGDVGFARNGTWIVFGW